MRSQSRRRADAIAIVKHLQTCFGIAERPGAPFEREQLEKVLTAFAEEHSLLKQFALDHSRVPVRASSGRIVLRLVKAGPETCSAS